MGLLRVPSMPSREETSSIASMKRETKKYVTEPAGLVAHNLQSAYKYSKLPSISGESSTDDDGVEAAPTSMFCQVLGVIISSLVCIGAATLISVYYMEDVLNWHGALGEWEGILLYSALYVAASFPIFFGYVVLNVGAGYIYGIWIGTAITTVATMFGCTLAVLLMTVCCRSCAVATKTQSGYASQIMMLIEGDQGFKIIAMTRMTPIPLGFQNAMLAATDARSTKPVRERYTTMTLATFVGLFPLQVVWVYMGTNLKSLTDVLHAKESSSSEAESIILMVVEVFITIAIVIFVRFQVKKQIDAALHEKGIDLGDDLEGGRSPTERTSLLAKVIQGQPGRSPSAPDHRENFDMTTQL